MPAEISPPPDPAQTTGFTSLARRFSVAVASLILLTLCVFWLISSYNTRNILHRQADDLGTALAQQTASLVTGLVLTNDLISLNVVLNQLTRAEAVAEAAVLNINGDVIAISAREPRPPRSILPVELAFGEYLAPVALEEGVAGSVRIRLDLTSVEAGIGNNLLFVTLAALLVMVAAVALTTAYFQYLVVFPLHLLNYALHGVRFGEIETCPDPGNNNEVGRVMRQYNSTAEFLARYSFISSLVQRAARPPATPGNVVERVTGALLCIRLDNFQYLASTRDERVMIDLQNRFNRAAESISRLYNGNISYCADGELVIEFNRGQLEDEQCFYAICAGQLFLRLLPWITHVEQRNRPPGAKFRLAVHFGDSLPGLYSPVTGEFNHMTGATLDLVRQSCSECPDNSLLVSAIAYEQAGGESRVVGEEMSQPGAHGGTGSYLCSNAMPAYRELFDKQAERLVSALESEPDSGTLAPADY